jgi:hypothetical protein
MSEDVIVSLQILKYTRCLTLTRRRYLRYDLKLWITHSCGGATYLPR